MQIYRNGTGPTTGAAESGFTGDVRIGGYFSRPAPSRLSGAVAEFPAGARTPWKRNSAGQTVIVLSGTGWAQSEGEPVVEIHAGDVVWFAPGIKHWEGATAEAPMTYAALHEARVEFLDKVPDELYLAGPATTEPR